MASPRTPSKTVHPKREHRHGLSTDQLDGQGGSSRTSLDNDRHPSVEVGLTNAQRATIQAMLDAERASIQTLFDRFRDEITGSLQDPGHDGGIHHQMGQRATIQAMLDAQRAIIQTMCDRFHDEAIAVLTRSLQDPGHDGDIQDQMGHGHAAHKESLQAECVYTHPHLPSVDGTTMGHAASKPQFYSHKHPPRHLVGASNRHSELSLPMHTLATSAQNSKTSIGTYHNDSQGSVHPITSGNREIAPQGPVSTHGPNESPMQPPSLLSVESTQDVHDMFGDKIPDIKSLGWRFKVMMPYYVCLYLNREIRYRWSNNPYHVAPEVYKCMVYLNVTCLVGKMTAIFRQTSEWKSGIVRPVDTIAELLAMGPLAVAFVIFFFPPLYVNLDRERSLS